MVLQKRLDYGFNGYQAPHVPRAARSARRRGPLKKNAGDSQMYAFDILATIAGKILLEGQNPTSSLSNGKLPEKHVLVPLKEEQRDPNRSLEDSSEGHASEITSSGCSDRIIYNEKTVLSSNKSDSVSQFRNVEALSSGLVGSCVPKLENHAEGQIESMQVDNVGEAPMGVGANSCISDGPKVFHGKAPSALVSSDNTIKPNILKSYYRCSSVFSSRDDYVGVVSKDDDEKSSLCTHRSAFIKRSKFPASVIDWKIRKLLGSRHWRVPSRVKDEDLLDNGGKFHSSYQYRKFGYNRQRSRRIYPLKKRKLLHYKSSSHSSDTSGSDGIHTSSEEATVDMSASGFGNDMFSSATESQVKMKIKSFRVPELFIDMPETATVGSLKRSVLEAISAFLGGELGIGVLVEGRKIRDDSKTLLQTGISHKNQPDALGFTLEPISSQVSSPMCFNNLHLRDIAPPIASGIGDQSAQATSSMAHRLNPPPSPDYQPNSISNVVESDHDSAPSPVEITGQKATADDSCRALVIVPDLKAEALAVVGPQQKYKRSEIAQRRIRRPFSVTEVEALVQAVEKLGTGRWRDVKLRAFDNIKHRTYVDLKDKWKTLVHTAKISPQQRRGAPVPQELLDRVLAAHAYWSQHQAKQHVKHQESRLQSCEEY